MSLYRQAKAVDDCADLAITDSDRARGITDVSEKRNAICCYYDRLDALVMTGKPLDATTKSTAQVSAAPIVSLEHKITSAETNERYKETPIGTSNSGSLKYDAPSTRTRRRTRNAMSLAPVASPTDTSDSEYLEFDAPRTRARWRIKNHRRATTTTTAKAPAA